MSIPFLLSLISPCSLLLSKGYMFSYLILLLTGPSNVLVNVKQVVWAERRLIVDVKVLYSCRLWEPLTIEAFGGPMMIWKSKIPIKHTTVQSKLKKRNTHSSRFLYRSLSFTFNKARMLSQSWPPLTFTPREPKRGQRLKPSKSTTALEQAKGGTFWVLK